MKLLAAARDKCRKRGVRALLLSAPVGGSLEKVLEKKRSCRRTNSVFVMTI
jgi:hypothetical protein